MTSTILDDFAAYQRAKGLSPRTIENREYMLRALERRCGVPLMEVGLRDLRAQLGREKAPGEPLARGTMQTERDCFRAFFRFLLEEGYRTDDPSERLAPVRAPRGEPRPYSSEQIDALLGSGSYRRTRVMILLGCYQGFRVGTIARVHGRDVDLAEGTIRAVGKGGKVRVLPLHPLVAEAAAAMPADDWWFPARNGAGGPIKSRSVTDLITRAKKRAGIAERELTPHSLRHSFGTHLVEGGVDIRIVQELMMHSSLATTQIYTGVNREQKQNGILQLPSRVVPTQSGRKAA
jgi:integrase/recombinase XerD